MQNLPPTGPVKRHKRYSRAVRFFRRIFTAPAGANSLAAGSHRNRQDDGGSLSTVVSSSSEMPRAVGEEQLQHQHQLHQPQHQHHQQQQQVLGCQHPHCRFHHQAQGPPGSTAAWTIEVTMPRCISCQVAQAAAAAAGAPVSAVASGSASKLPPRQQQPQQPLQQTLTPSPSQWQVTTPTLTARKSPMRKPRTPTPPPPPVALLPCRRQSSTQLQAAASRENGEKPQHQDKHRFEQLLKQEHQLEQQDYMQQHQLEQQIKHHQHQLEQQIKHQHQLEQQIKHQHQLEQQIKHQHQLEQQVKHQHQHQLEQQIKDQQKDQSQSQGRLPLEEKLQQVQHQLQRQKQTHHQVLHQLQHESRQQQQLHQSTPASKSFSAADQTEPIDLSGCGSRTRQHPISLRAIDSTSKSTSPLSVVRQETQVRSRQLPLVPRTLWLRSETATQASPLPPATPTETASTVTTAAAASPVAAARAAANRRPLPTASLLRRPSGVLEGSPEAVRLPTTLQRPPQPPPQLSKLRPPPVVMRAPQRSLTPSPVRGAGGGSGGRVGGGVRSVVDVIRGGGGGGGEGGSGSGGGGGDGGSAGAGVETASATGSTQSSGPTPPPTQLQGSSSTASASVTASTSIASSTAVSTRAPRAPFLGRVAETVRRFNSIRPNHTTGPVVAQSSGPIRLAKSFRSVAADAPTASVDTTKLALDSPVTPGPSATVTISSRIPHGGPRTSPHDKPRPNFRELLAKFESFDRRRRECLAKAEAVAVQAATAEATTATTMAKASTKPQPLAEGLDVPGIAEATLLAASSTKEDFSAATTDELPAADAIDSEDASLTDDNDAVGTGPDQRDLAEAAEAVQTAVAARRPGVMGRSLRFVLLCLVGLCLGHAVLRLLLTFESELAGMRSQR